jgi:excisionase family DNA binding protein
MTNDIGRGDLNSGLSPQFGFEPLAVTIADACRLIGLGRSKLYEEISTGRIKALKAGKRTLIPVASLKDWLARLEAA